MMADGYSRNEAMEMAKLVQKDNGTYAKTYDVVHALKCFPELAEAVHNLVDSWINTFAQVAEAVIEGAKTFIRRFNEIMDGR